MTAVKTACEYGFPRSNNVGRERAWASNLADATTPQTVAVSPMRLAASSGRKSAALAEKAHNPIAANAVNTLAGFMAPLQQCTC